MHTCTDATNDRSCERRFGSLVHCRQETEQQSVARHGVEDSRNREYTSYQSKTNDIKTITTHYNYYIIVLAYAACLQSLKKYEQYNYLRGKKREYRTAGDQVFENRHSQVFINNR